MAESTILTWNMPNWITVVLMALVAFFVLGMVSQVVKSRRAAAAA